MEFTQNYAPFINVILSAILASTPFLVLCYQLVIKKRAGHIAALSALSCSFALSIFVWDMPFITALSSGIFGSLFGAFPILWIILSSMWLYNMTVDSGQFNLVRYSISSLSEDRRIQAIFIAFAFGALLESTAGYGSPVAIGAAMLIGLGFKPLQAAGLCLIANTVPVAYAGMGLPMLVAAQVSELDAFRISQVVGLQLPLLAFFVPTWLSVLVCGFKKSMEIWLVLVVAGLGSSVPTFIFSQYHGYTLPGLMGALGSLVGTAILLCIWKPKNIYRFENDVEISQSSLYSGKEIFIAWLPWIMLTLMVFVPAIGDMKLILDGIFNLNIEFPYLHNVAIKVAPLVSEPSAMPAIFKFNLMSTIGTWIFISALICPLIMPNYSYKSACKMLAHTLKQMRFSILTILLILALSQVMNYSGMSYSLGLAFTHTGFLFAIFAPFIGWIGVFLTGSDTSSNALFCGMQRTTAEAVGIDPYLTTAANTTGGVAAKMISPQSISVAVGVTNMQGQEGEILKYTIKHSLGMLLIISIICFIQSL